VGPYLEYRGLRRPDPRRGSRRCHRVPSYTCRTCQVDSSPTPPTARDAFLAPAECGIPPRRQRGRRDSLAVSTPDPGPRWSARLALGVWLAFVGATNGTAPRSCGLAFHAGLPTAYRIRGRLAETRPAARAVPVDLTCIVHGGADRFQCPRTDSLTTWTRGRPIGEQLRPYTRPQRRGLDSVLMSSVRGRYVVWTAA